MAKQGAATQGRAGKGGRVGRQGGETSAEDIRAQVAAILQQVEKTIETEYHTKFSNAIKGMEEDLAKTAKAQYDMVTQNITAAQTAWEQVQEYHKEASAEIDATRKELQRNSQHVEDYKNDLNKILAGAEEHVNQLKKKYKIT